MIKVLNKLSLFCSMLLLAAVGVFSASAEAPQEALGHISQHRFALFDPTSRDLKNLGIIAGDPREILRYSERPNGESLVETMGWICASVLESVTVQTGSDWSLLDPTTIEERIRLVTLHISAPCLARMMNGWATIQERQGRLPAGIKSSLLPAFMKIANEALWEEEMKGQSEFNYKEDADQIEANDDKDIGCLNILAPFNREVMRFCLDNGNWEHELVKKSHKELLKLIQIAMRSPDFSRIILDLLNAADKLKPDTERNRGIKHVAELIKIIRYAGPIYRNMVGESNMGGSSDELKQIFHEHVVKFLK